MSLLAWYPLNGNLKDYAFGKYNGTVIGNLPVNPNGKIGQTYEFINNENGISIASNLVDKLSGKDYTFSVWVHPKANHRNYTGTIISSGNWNASNWAWGVAQNNSGITYPGLSFSTYYGRPLELNKWTHIVTTSRNGIVTLYQNGVKTHSIKATPAFRSDANNTTIGRETYANGHFAFNGFMNDLRIYDECLSVKEIKELYKLKILDYKFNDFKESTTNLKNTVSFNTAQKGPDYFIKDTTDQWYNGATLPSTPVTAGKTYTWSIDIKSDRPITLSWDANCTASNYSGNDSAMETSQKSTPTYVNPGKWERVFLTVTVKSDAQSPTLHHTFCPRFVDTPLKIYVKNAQLEQKDHMTEYTSSKRNSIIRDSSGYGFHSKVLAESPTLKWMDNSPIGSGCYKMGTSDTITHPNPFLGQSTSIQEWTVVSLLRIDTDCPTSASINNFNHSNRLIQSTTPLLYLNSGDHDYYSYGSKVLNKNEWIHVAYVFRNSDGLRKIYMNGVDVTSSPGPNKTSSPSGIPSEVTIGTNFKGYLANYKIYASALNAEDILNDYQSRGYITDNGKLFVNEIIEKPNLAHKMNKALVNKQFTDGLITYTQEHCLVTLTDDGYRIFRTPNLVYPDAGNVMWGGAKLQFPEGTFNKGRKYLLSFKAKGQTSNAMGAPYLCPQMGWTTGGLTQIGCTKTSIIPSNFNSKEYQHFWALFDLTNFNVFQKATSTSSIFVKDTWYNCCRDLALGFGYTSTGSLGTDIYIKDLRLIDVTDGLNSNINIKSQLIAHEISEKDYLETEGTKLCKIYKHGLVKSSEFNII